MKKNNKETKKTVKKVTAKKDTTTKKETTKKVDNHRINKRLNSTKFTLILTIIGIIASLGCVYIDLLNDVYYKMPLYAILLFIIVVEDKK